MSETLKPCVACSDGIPLKTFDTTECPDCGRKVESGMAIRINAHGQPVWDYPKPKEPEET